MSRNLDDVTRAAHRRQNFTQSVVLLGAIACVLGLSAYILSGLTGVLSVSTAILLIAVFAPRVPPDAVMRLYRATRIANDDSQISSLVDVLAFRAGLPRRPVLYVIPSMTLNAFATGTPERCAIAVTEGLLRRLTLREIAGVLAHEISHVRNNDLWVMGLADIVTRLLQVFSYVALVLAIINLFATLTGRETMSWLAIALLYLAPALSSLLQLGLSRSREFDADLEAASLTGDTIGLASALKRLETYTGHFWEDLMFPVPARRVPQPSLLRTHPPTEVRIARLMSLGRQHHPDPLVIVERPMVSLVGMGPIEMRPRYRWPGLWY
jgi:heat shock protein HtpX